MTEDILTRARADFRTLTDGEIYWIPTCGVAMSAGHIRLIADELEKRNRNLKQKGGDPCVPICQS